MLRLALLVESGATGWEGFAVFSVVAFALFASVLRLALRKRKVAVWPKVLVAGVFIVFGGMLFARWTNGLDLPWRIFYGLPALATFLVPPFLFRMSGHETARVRLYGGFDGACDPCFLFLLRGLARLGAAVLCAISLGPAAMTS